MLSICKAVIMAHTRYFVPSRALLESGLEADHELALARRMGWTRHGSGKWTVVWSHLPEASKVCAELLHCRCTNLRM